MLAQSWALLYELGGMIEKESVMVSLEMNRSIDNARYLWCEESITSCLVGLRPEVGGAERARM